MPWPMPQHASQRGKADVLRRNLTSPSPPTTFFTSLGIWSLAVGKDSFCLIISRRPYSIVPTVYRSALVPAASPAMCFTSGSGASSRSIFNDLFAVISLNLEPCCPTYCLSSAASGPALLSRFTSPSTGIRPQVWQLAAILLSVCVAHNPFCLPGSLTLLCRCGAARWRVPCSQSQITKRKHTVQAFIAKKEYKRKYILGNTSCIVGCLEVI